MIKPCLSTDRSPMTTNPNNYNHINPLFEPGISQDEQVERYTNYATFYEQDVVQEGYIAPAVTAEAIGQFYPNWREKYEILDIAAGTGFVAQELQKLGFRNIDGLEPSEGMVKLAREKNIYRNLTVSGLSTDPLEYKSDSYDGITICGWHGNAQPLCDSLEEMIRILKQGGIICITTRSHYVKNLPDFRDIFLKKLKVLEEQGLWKQIEYSFHFCYPFNNEGVRIVYQKN